MKKQNNIINALKFAAVVLATVLMMQTAMPAFALSSKDSGPVMVSLGDSYSSGEGVEPFYCADKEDKYSQPDWLAHRSRLSWPGKLHLTDSKGRRIVMAQHKANYSQTTKSYDSFDKNNWYFVASSGAVTGSLKGSQHKSYDINLTSDEPTQYGSYRLDSQLKVFESIDPGTTDYVTMTMGGNDAHFADVFVYAALNCSFLNVNGINDYIDTIWDEYYNGSNSIKNRAIKAYTDIRNAAGKQADIIIAGYPKILPKGGFLIFSASESRAIDNGITALNGEIKKITDSLRSDDFKIHFVSVEEAFEGHEIYTGMFTSYINGIKFAKDEDLSKSQIISSYSLHPNNRGLKAYAECVQACIDSIEQQKAQGGTATQAQSVDKGESAVTDTAPTEQIEELTTTRADEISTLAGDVNNDGCVSIIDISQIVTARSASEPDPALDLNSDGIISSKDVAMIVFSDNYAKTDLSADNK